MNSILVAQYAQITDFVGKIENNERVCGPQLKNTNSSSNFILQDSSNLKKTIEKS